MTVTQAGRPADARNARHFVQAGGLIFYLLAVQGLMAFGVGLYGFLSGGGGQDLVLPATGAILAVCYAFVGYYLRRYRLWARNFAFAFAAVSVFAFPAGTVVGALIVLCIDRANRAGVFPSRPRPAVPEAEPETALLRFDPTPVPAAAE
jgi:hypothetical protein